MGCGGSKDDHSANHNASSAAGMNLGPPPKREETPAQKAAKEREKQEEAKWIEVARNADRNAPTKPILEEGASEGAYKEYMRARYDFEQWENGLILAARKLRKEHTDAGRTWLVDGGTPGAAGGGAGSASATLAPTARSAAPIDGPSERRTQEQPAAKPATPQMERKAEAPAVKPTPAVAPVAATATTSVSVHAAPPNGVYTKLGLPAPESMSTDPQTVEVIRELQSFLAEGLVTRADYDMKIAELR